MENVILLTYHKFHNIQKPSYYFNYLFVIGWFDADKTLELEKLERKWKSRR